MNMVVVLIMLAKVAALGLSNKSTFKIKVFWNKGYDVIVSVHDVRNKILSCETQIIL